MIRMAVVFLLVQGLLAAQSGMDVTGAKAEPQVYSPPTAAERWYYLYNSAFSPAASGGDAVSAVYRHVVGSVPEWGHGAEGYGRRLGWTVMNNVAQSAVESGVAAALHEDNAHYRCACSGFWRRSAHALVSQITTRRPDGRRSFSFACPIGAYGGAMVAASVLPQRFTLEGDGCRNGTWNYAVGFPLNLLHEFWPEIRRGVLRREWKGEECVFFRITGVVMIFSAAVALGQVSPVGEVENVYDPYPGESTPLCKACQGNSKNQPITGMRILWDLSKHDDEWSGGRILDPDTGKTYKCSLTLDGGGNRLKVRGFLLRGAFR